jgi:hypothetical protein
LEEDLVKLNGNLSLLYSIDKENMVKIEKILKENSKINKYRQAENINEYARNISDIKYYSFPEEKSKKISLKLNRIYIAKIFKEDKEDTDNFLNFFLIISLELHNYNEKYIQTSEILDSISKDFFLNLPSNKSEIAKYIRIVNNNLDDEYIGNLLELKKEDDYKNFEETRDAISQLYINTKEDKYIVLENIEGNRPRDITKVPLFLLAYAYKKYYQEELLKISDKLSSEDLSEKLLEIDAINFISNPTTKDFYEIFSKKLKIEESRSAFIESLNNPNKDISINKEETEQKEQELKEEQEEYRKEKNYNNWIAGLIVISILIALSQLRL